MQHKIKEVTSIISVLCCWHCQCSLLLVLLVSCVARTASAVCCSHCSAVCCWHCQCSVLLASAGTVCYLCLQCWMKQLLVHMNYTVNDKEISFIAINLNICHFQFYQYRPIPANTFKQIMQKESLLKVITYHYALCLHIRIYRRINVKRYERYQILSL